MNPAMACCICGNDLPSRYAVAGRCAEKSCAQAFCALHWNRSNGRCRDHGYAEVQPKPEENPPPAVKQETNMNEPDRAAQPQAEKKITLARAKSAMAEALNLTKKLGAGAMELFKKLQTDRSPQAMLQTIEGQLAANSERRGGVSARLEQQFKEVAAKKKAYDTAPPARKRILEAELQSMVAVYRANERELKVLLENERVLAQVKGRMNEVMAYGMAGVKEEAIDELTDQVEEAVEEAEGRVGAADDLEKAGRRRERESTRESFMEQLGEFSEEAAATPAGADLSEFNEPAPAPTPEKKPAAPEQEPP